MSIIVLHNCTGRLYVLYINRTYRRSGTLWEGRHKASLVNAEEYLLTCYRYIELNPVAAGIVNTPEQYRWSSYRWHAWGNKNIFIHDHALYQQLGSTMKESQYAYRDLFKLQIPDEDIHKIKKSLDYNYPLGNDHFKQQIENALGRAVGHNRRGRPNHTLKIDLKLNHSDPLLSHIIVRSMQKIQLLQSLYNDE